MPVILGVVIAAELENLTTAATACNKHLALYNCAGSDPPESGNRFPAASNCQGKWLASLGAPADHGSMQKEGASVLVLPVFRQQNARWITEAR